MSSQIPHGWKVTEQSGCWLWRGKITTNGYGWGFGDYAHRVSYRRFVGPIPTGRQVHHVCGNRSCVNPDHLQVLTPETHGRVTRSGQTHCKHGHEFTPENTYWARGPNGRYRHCRECQRRRNREFAERQK